MKMILKLLSTRESISFGKAHFKTKLTLWRYVNGSNINKSGKTIFIPDITHFFSYVDPLYL